jgi:hypothetical protein
MVTYADNIQFFIKGFLQNGPGVHIQLSAWRQACMDVKVTTKRLHQELNLKNIKKRP